MHIRHATSMWLCITQICNRLDAELRQMQQRLNMGTAALTQGLDRVKDVCPICMLSSEKCGGG